MSKTITNRLKFDFLWTNAEQFNNKRRFQLPKTIIWQLKMINQCLATVILAVKNAGFLIKWSTFIDSLICLRLVPTWFPKIMMKNKTIFLFSFHLKIAFVGHCIVGKIKKSLYKIKQISICVPGNYLFTEFLLVTSWNVEAFLDDTHFFAKFMILKPEY